MPGGPPPVVRARPALHPAWQPHLAGPLRGPSQPTQPWGLSVPAWKGPVLLTLLVGPPRVVSRRTSRSPCLVGVFCPGVLAGKGPQEAEHHAGPCALLARPRVDMALGKHQHPASSPSEADTTAGLGPIHHPLTEQVPQQESSPFPPVAPKPRHWAPAVPPHQCHVPPWMTKVTLHVSLWSHCTLPPLSEN